MLNNIMIGKYYPVRSKIHFMNPISKMICLILFLVTLHITSNLLLIIPLVLLTIIYVLNTQIPLIVYFKTINSIKFLLFFVFIINLLINTPMEYNIILLIRLILIVLYTTILTLTTPPGEITYALEVIFSPLKFIKIPVNKIALSLSLALRFIPTIIDQANKILKSQASRGIDYYNSNIKNRMIAVKSLLIPLFKLTLKRADQLADAMEIRLYSVNKKRTNFRMNKWKYFDTFLVLLHVSILIIYIVRGVK